MKFARDKFFDGYRAAFGSLDQSQVDGLNSLLTGFESDPRWSSVQLIAYALATVRHETGLPGEGPTFRPVSEFGSDKYLSKYWTNPTLRKNLGNKEPEDAQRYKGRGYVQITGRNNYTRFGIADDPEKALEPQKAFEIMTDGMFKGAFTGKKITDYISSKGTDYHNARKVINGLDKADLIEDYANKFEEILTDSQAPDTAIELQTDMPGGVTVTATSTEPEKITAEDMQGVVTGHADSAKSIIARASLKIGSFLAVIWGSGVAGKAFLIIVAIVIIFGAAYELNKYWPKFKPWAVNIFKGLGKK